MSLPLDHADILARPLLAHLASQSADGPRHSPVWFLWEDETLWIISGRDDSMAKRIEADPRCAVGVVDFDLENGILLHIGIRGTARIEPYDEARRNRLLAKYIGSPNTWRADFLPVIETIDCFIAITPNSIVARDQSYFAPHSPRSYQ